VSSFEEKQKRIRGRTKTKRESHRRGKRNYGTNGGKGRHRRREDLKHMKG
jgi:hypothetical protein